MKKILMGILASVVITAGSASADSGYWFGAGTTNATTWETFLNVVNTGGTTTTATALFYELDGTYIGSTTHSIASNGGWNFGLGSVGTINSSEFDDVITGSRRRGTVIIRPLSGGAAAGIHGYATMFNSSSSSGFNFSNPE